MAAKLGGGPNSTAMTAAAIKNLLRRNISAKKLFVTMPGNSFKSQPDFGKLGALAPFGGFPLANSLASSGDQLVHSIRLRRGSCTLSGPGMAGIEHMTDGFRQRCGFCGESCHSVGGIVSIQKRAETIGS